MMDRLLFIFLIGTFYLTVDSSINDVVVTCVNECTVTNGEITATDLKDIKFTYLINNAGFTSLILKYDEKTILTASTSKVSPSNDHDVRFKFPKTDVSKVGGKFSFNFLFTKLQMVDTNKMFFFNLNINNNEFSKSLTLNVKGGPVACGPSKGTYTIEEGNGDDVLWQLCGNPPPIVKANIGRKYYEVIKSLPTPIREHAYLYRVKLNDMHRTQCGNKLYLEATGYKQITRSAHIIVEFTPPQVNNFNSRYDSLNDCATLTWSDIEAGDCAVKYILKYDNQYDEIDAIFYETPGITYTLCGTNIGYNFSIKAVVDRISGSYSDPISRTGISKLVGSDDVFPWYYILIVVIVVIIILLCVLILLQRTKNTDAPQSTKGIKTANALDVYSTANRKRETVASDNRGYREDGEKLGSDKPSSQLDKFSRKKEKSLNIIYGGSISEDTVASGSIPLDVEENRASAERSSKPDCGERSFTVTFQNIEDNPVKLFWKDFQGNEKFCRKINSGRDHPVIAFIDYSYIVRDTVTNNLLYFKKADKFDIIFRGLEFGAGEVGINHVIITSKPEMDIPIGLINHRYDNDDNADADSVNDINVVPHPDHLVYAEVAPKSRLTSFHPSYRVPSKPAVPSRNDARSIADDGEITCTI